MSARGAAGDNPNPIPTSGEMKAEMKRTRRPLRLLALLVAALAALAAAPALAAAITITVDDDAADCPLADYATLPTAVAAAANGDTIHVCPGTYYVPGGSGSAGLKIEKNLTIEGAGADKVFVSPTPGSGSMARPSPNPRDEYGNVITVRRRLIQLFDVSISGLTVRAGDVPVEAGIAMIDVDVGLISGVRVEGIVPVGGPGTGAYAPSEVLAAHGQGVIVANTIEATDNVTTITGSAISGFNATGLLVDNRLLNGAASVGNGSRATAKLVNTSISGAGGTPPVAQTGIEAWGSGARVRATKSSISGVGSSSGTAAAVALHGADVAGSYVGGSAADAVNLDGSAYGITNVAYNGSAAGSSLAAGDNYWGSTLDGSSAPLVGPDVTVLPVAAAAPPAPTIAAVSDAPPSVEWDARPAAGAMLKAGDPVPLAVFAADDFGVKKVEFQLDGVPVGVAPNPALNGDRIYSLSWTPSAASAGASRVLSAVATDSAGQVTRLEVTVSITAPPAFTAAAGVVGGLSGPYAVAGSALSCSSGSPSGYPVTLSYEWMVNGATVATTPTYVPSPVDQGKRVSCAVTASNPLGSVSGAGGLVLVAVSPTVSAAASLSGAAASYAVLGETLTCSAAGAGDPEPTVSYAWLRDGAPIDGASGDTYVVTEEDAIHEISCEAEISSLAGSVVSLASIGVGGAPGGGTATLSGADTVGSALSCESSAWTALPSAEVSYSWLKDEQPIESAVGATYVTTLADIGARISCRVTATNALGSAEATSTALTVTEAPPATSTALPPVITKLGAAVAKLTGAKAVLATVGCDVGPCEVSAPKKVLVRIAGKKYQGTVLVPAGLAPGESAQVAIKLPKKALKALKKAGKSAKVVVKLTIVGGGGTVTEAVVAQLGAPAKPKKR